MNFLPQQAPLHQNRSHCEGYANDGGVRLGEMERPVEPLAQLLSRRYRDEHRDYHGLRLGKMELDVELPEVQPPPVQPAPVQPGVQGLPGQLGVQGPTGDRRPHVQPAPVQPAPVQPSSVELPAPLLVRQCPYKDCHGLRKSEIESPPVQPPQVELPQVELPPVELPPVEPIIPNIRVIIPPQLLNNDRLTIQTSARLSEGTTFKMGDQEGTLIAQENAAPAINIGQTSRILWPVGTIFYINDNPRNQSQIYRGHQNDQLPVGSSVILPAGTEIRLCNRRFLISGFETIENRTIILTSNETPQK